VVNDVVAPFGFSTTKAVFASGRELGASARTGPAWIGLIVMTPSIPVSEPDCVWPGKKPAHMVKTIRMTGTFPNGILKFTRATPWQSIMAKHEGIQNDAMTNVLRAWCFFIRHSNFVINGARFFNLACSLRDYASTNQVASRT
jgi:hypothetical protein